MPVITPETYFSSENPIIQKCFDILKDKNVMIEGNNSIYRVYKGIIRKYSVSSVGLLWIGDIVFDADKLYDGMSFKDVYKLYQRCEYLYGLGDYERVQQALIQLGGNLEQKPEQSLALFDRIRNGFRKIFTPSKNK